MDPCQWVCPEPCHYFHSSAKLSLEKYQKSQSVHWRQRVQVEFRRGSSERFVTLSINLIEELRSCFYITTLKFKAGDDDYLTALFFLLPVSPDGLLQQSSTVADSVSFQFSDGITESVPCSYIEFAERLVLPQYKNIPEREVTNRLIFLFDFSV